MDLKSGRAVVLPAKGKDFDPTSIPKAVKDAGFTPGEIEVTVTGILAWTKDMLLLKLPGLPHQFVLAGGPAVGELNQQRDLIGKLLRVTGKLHPSHADRPPGMTVERWAPAGPSK